MIQYRLSRPRAAGLMSWAALTAVTAHAQTPNAVPPPAIPPAAPNLEQRVTELTEEVDELKKLVHRLQEQLVKANLLPASPETPPAAVGVAPVVVGAAPPVPPAPAAPAPASGWVAAYLPQGVTINALLDGYYEYNFNSPVGRVNELRAYDVSSNSFSLNQADLVVEDAPDLAAGRRFGMRLDFQFGQATSTLQGNPANELRPEVYRNIFQAYGTYVFPVAGGLTVDFGKWAS